MPVVINEFEVIPAREPMPGPAGSEPAPESTQKAVLEICALANALRALEEQDLRVWAH